MINFPNNDANYRFQIDDPHRFKQTYKACEEVLNRYPKELTEYKTSFIVDMIGSVLNIILFGIGIITFWWFIGLGIWLILGVFHNCWRIKKHQKLLKEAEYVKEKFDFIISYNSTPLKGDEWKGPRDPWNPFI